MQTTNEISNKIQILPEHLIDQIKAGEVIERASSLIKELIENSIDANATKISIHIANNGLDFIKVTDNGNGILFHDLPYAFCRHATSKIDRFEDIYGLESFGFRGEALASMASIARVICSSKTATLSDEDGGRIELHGGKLITHQASPQRQVGTNILVEDLFYNTPARLKFIKSQSAEKLSLKRILNNFLLAHPLINFEIQWDQGDKDIYHSQSQLERIKKVLFKKNTKNQEVLSFEVDYEDHYVEVFVSQSSTKGNAGKKQFLFANDRLFYDKSIHQTIVRNFEHYWGQSHSGHYVVFINVPNHLIDVNVHPHKTQIKFFKPGIITSLISSGIKANTPEKKEIYSQGIEPLITKINFENPVAPEEFKEKNITQIHMLENCCSLLKIEQKFYIVSLKKLFIEFWSNVLQDRNLSEDLQVTPLLIAWPFKEYSNLSVSSIHLLEDWGLEFDLLNDGTPLLKAIPEKLDQTTIPFFVEPLIDLSINNQELLLVNRESLQSLAVSNSQEMYLHIKENLQTLMSSDTLVSLNDKTLEQIFLENE